MTVLLLGDITSRSRVALRMLTAVLEERGHEVLMLPTVLISNTLNLGKHAMLDTTDYLLETLKTWKELGIHCDLAYIGYVTGMKQALALADVADDLRAQGVKVVVDPILGDNGRRYHSITPEQVQGMELLCGHADLITPNMTEACLLCGAEYEADMREGRGMDAAKALGGKARSVLITSASTPDVRDAIAGFDAQTGEVFCVPFERVPGHHWGTGDLFTGLMMDGLMGGMPLEAAARDAAMHVAAQLRGEEKSLLPRQ
ncbi:MAG: PfkB family carbohydrate kinase [Eubacteriales bacterium]|nr:PfkB family carbohydrate kinase [Eubacteriales bacterium]